MSRVVKNIITYKKAPEKIIQTSMPVVKLKVDVLKLEKQKLDFDDIVNSQTGKIGFVLGTGPSLKKYLKQFEELSNNKEKYCFVSCNDWDIMTKIKVDYWVVANSVFTVKSRHQRFNAKPNTILVYADSVDLTPRNQVQNLLKNKYLPYDQRHFNNKVCPKRGKCCLNQISGRLTIQEYLKKISKALTIYGCGDTVAVHMLSTAVILGCNPIYMVGVDLDYTKGYVDGISKNTHNFEQYMDRTRESFKIITESAELLNIKIINLNENAPYEIPPKGKLKL